MNKRSNVALTDDQFLDRLAAHGGNLTALGLELGVSQPAISKRRNRILAGRGRAQGQASAIAMEMLQAPVPYRPSNVHKPTARFIQREIAEGAVEYRRQLEVMDLLLESDEIVKDILAQILNEVKERGGKSRPRERQQLLEIADRRERLAKTLVDIHTKIQAAGTLRAFIDIVCRVVTQESPDVKQRLYHALRDAGPLLRLASGLGDGS